MKPIRWLLAGVVWIVAGLLGLVGVLVSVTVILLPIGIPLLMLSRRLYSLAAMLVVPRGVRHPVQEAGKTSERRAHDLQDVVGGGGKSLRRKGRKAMEAARQAAPDPVASVLPKRRGFARVLHPRG